MIGADAIGTSDLRLVWPQWQGAGSESIRALASESHFEVARRGYCVGTNVLQAVRPEHDGPTAVVPVEMGDAGLEERDGIEAKTVLLHQLRDALDILQDHNAARITTLGGECSVSMAPFSYLINKYGEDMALRHWSTGNTGSAPRRSPFTSTSTRSTPTKSSWASVPTSAV